MFEVCIENAVLDSFTEEVEWREQEQREFVGDVGSCHLLYIRAESKDVAEKIALDLFAEWKAHQENLI